MLIHTLPPAELLLAAASPGPRPRISPDLSAPCDTFVAPVGAGFIDLMVSFVTASDGSLATVPDSAPTAVSRLSPPARSGAFAELLVL